MPMIFATKCYIYIVFVFKIFIDMHLVTPKTKIPVIPRMI